MIKFLVTEIEGMHGLNRDLNGEWVDERPKKDYLKNHEIFLPWAPMTGNSLIIGDILFDIKCISYEANKEYGIIHVSYVCKFNN